MSCRASLLLILFIIISTIFFCRSVILMCEWDASIHTYTSWISSKRVNISMSNGKQCVINRAILTNIFQNILPSMSAWLDQTETLSAMYTHASMCVCGCLCVRENLDGPCVRRSIAVDEGRKTTHKKSILFLEIVFRVSLKSQACFW